jgi:hypothetical protein
MLRTATAEHNSTTEAGGKDAAPPVLGEAAEPADGALLSAPTAAGRSLTPRGAVP